MKFLGRRHLGKRRLDLSAAARAIAPGFGHFSQISPLIAAGSQAREELIDPNCATVAALGHYFLPICKSPLRSVAWCFYLLSHLPPAVPRPNRAPLGEEIGIANRSKTSFYKRSAADIMAIT